MNHSAGYIGTVIPMPDPGPWICCRQRAGPLVKECRALRPRFSSDDTDQDRKAKAAIKRSAVSRQNVDRLEIRLALFGNTGTHYTLTYDDDHLPGDFGSVRRSLRAYLARVARWREMQPLDYIYAIEGLHGDRRYHIHFVADYGDISPAEVRRLWRQGEVDDEPVLLTRSYRDPRTGEWVKVSDGGFRRLAEYLNKERTDGVVIPIGRHPWSCSRSLGAKVPPPERWRDTSGVIEIPSSSMWARRGASENDFGAYNFASWIDASAF